VLERHLVSLYLTTVSPRVVNLSNCSFWISLWQKGGRQGGIPLVGNEPLPLSGGGKCNLNKGDAALPLAS